MRSENFELWLHELRTTDKKQCDGGLYDPENDSYCCLGIGSALMGLEPVIDQEQPYALFGGVSSLAPRVFIEWLLGRPVERKGSEFNLWPDWGELGDLQFADVFGTVGLGRLSASALNDAGFTFAQIADIFDYFGFVDHFGFVDPS